MSPYCRPGGGGDELERRARRVLALDGAVEQRIAGVVEQGLVVGLADAPDELGRVVGGVGRQGQDLAVAGILDDRRSGRRAEVASGDALSKVCRAAAMPCSRAVSAIIWMLPSMVSRRLSPGDRLGRADGGQHVAPRLGSSKKTIAGS